LHSRELSAELLRAFDCVVIGVDHDCFDYGLVLRESALLIDTRGRVREKNERVFRA